jgi:3-(3-hydroxy-phenyl)propionate hydroxylase
MGTYSYTRFAYHPPGELTGTPALRRPVVIVGAGPVGLSAAIDLALQGVPCVVLDDNDAVADGSRAICWAKRTLEIFDRLGVAQRMVTKGVTWQVGRVYHGERELYQFDLLPEGGHKMPAFINLQQYYVEEFLVERAREFPHLIELRWKNRATAVRNLNDTATVTVATPDGDYSLQCDWLIAADGARSSIRAMLGHRFEGHTFEDKFLIVDVRMDAAYPSDRRFWFQPPFDRGDSVLIHRQPDHVFRIDFQLARDADAEAERDPERAMERVRRVVGPRVQCEFEWCSVYTFRCARMARFIDGRIIFAGDAAHVVSPFGARGGNGGIQDADNLCWKLARVIRREAPAQHLESYQVERGRAADENILNSRRTSGFMSPGSVVERQFRDAVLDLAATLPFARGLVNSGRLSKPCHYTGLPAMTDEAAVLAGAPCPGSPCPDAPVTRADGTSGWLLEHLGTRPCALTFVEDEAAAVRVTREGIDCGIPGLAVIPVGACGPHGTGLLDPQRLITSRYGGAAGVTYLIRPDQHVLGRWSRFDAGRLRAAWDTYRRYDEGSESP